MEDVLSKYYSKDALKMCFVEKSSQSRDPAYSALPSSTNEEYKDDDESNTISDQASISYRNPKLFSPKISSHAISFIRPNCVHILFSIFISLIVLDQFWTI